MMGRAERRRTQKLEQKAKTATYNLTKEQLNIAVREQVGKELERIKQEATDDAVNTAMVLLLTLPLEVLMDIIIGQRPTPSVFRDLLNWFWNITNAGKMESWIWIS